MFVCVCIVTFADLYAYPRKTPEFVQGHSEKVQLVLRTYAGRTASYSPCPGFSVTRGLTY